MRRLIKNYIFVIIIGIFMFNGFIIANAEAVRINDYANLFSYEEIQNLTVMIDEVIDNHNIDVVIVTTNDVEGKTSRDYADDFYDYNGYGLDEVNSGVLFLINMEAREVYISTCGNAIDYFTDARIDSILDSVYEDLSKGNYYDSANEFLENVDYYMAKGVPSNQYRIDEEGNRIKVPMTKGERINRVIISLLISVSIATISCLVVVINYKKPNKKGSTENYIDEKSIFFTSKKDEFVSSHISKVKINRDNNNGGGSSIHQSSSGTSHGGGGRGF